jgi:hypothetical protein
LVSLDESAPDVKAIAQRPLFWVSIVLLLVPTVWLAIDIYAMRDLAPVSSNPHDNGKTAFTILSFATSYAPGLVCLLVAIFAKRKAQSTTPRSSI